MLKALALVLGERLRPMLSKHCYHLAGHGGLPGAVRAVRAHVGEERWPTAQEAWDCRVRGRINSSYATVPAIRCVPMRIS